MSERIATTEARQEPQHSPELTRVCSFELTR
jgi:hypothetical protein